MSQKGRGGKGKPGKTSKPVVKNPVAGDKVKHPGPKVGMTSKALSQGSYQEELEFEAPPSPRRVIGNVPEIPHASGPRPYTFDGKKDGEEVWQEESASIYTVTGRVQNCGRAGAARLVKVFARDSQGETPLASAEIDENGYYEARFPEPTKGFTPALNLKVRVFADKEKEVAESFLLMNAGSHEIVNIALGDETYAAPSRFDELRLMLEKHFIGRKLEELTLEDVALFIQETMHTPRDVFQLIKAHQLTNESKLPVAALFAWLHQGLGNNLFTILQADNEVLEKALHQAASRGLISAVNAGALDEILRLVDKERLRAWRGEDSSGYKDYLAKVMQDLGFASDKIQAVLALYFAKPKVHEFSQALLKSKILSKDEMSQLMLGAQIGLLAGSDQSLAKLLHAMRVEKKINSSDDFVKFDWYALLNKHADKLTVPQALQGLEPGMQFKAWARVLREKVLATQPLASLLHEIDNHDDGCMLLNANKFFKQNKNFSFTKGAIKAFVQDPEANLQGIEDRDALVKEVEALQRLQRLAVYPEKVMALYGRGFKSANDIVKGKTGFIKSFGSQFGAAAAKKLYAKSRKTVERTALAFTTMHQEVMSISLPMVSAGVDRTLAPASWSELFGSESFCACDHCRTIFSPAAYLVDLFEFIDEKSSDETDGLAMIRERRPDLTKLLLNCKNTNTLMPYIDLVNEILEIAVMTESDPTIVEPTVYNRNTLGTEDELRANPEYFFDRAYRVLRQEPYGLKLPFDYWYEEPKNYLAKLKVTPWALFEACQKNINHPEMQLFAAKETFGVCAEEWAVLCGLHPWFNAGSTASEGPWSLWGFAGQDVAGTPWLAALAKVSKFLLLADISYDELWDLAQTDYVRGKGEIKFRFPGNKETCDLEKISLEFLPNNQIAGANSEQKTANFLSAVYCFIRLKHKLSWSFRDLDLYWRRLGGSSPLSAVDETFARRMAAVFALSKTLPQTPVRHLAAWWGNMDLRGWQSLFPAEREPADYDKRFFDHTLLSRFGHSEDGVPLTLDPFAKDANRELLLWEINGTQPLLYKDHVARVLAAFGMEQSELEFLLGGDLNQPVTTASLSYLYRYQGLAQLLKMKIQDLVGWRDLIKDDNAPSAYPFTNPEETVAFTEAFESFKRSGYTLVELRYLLQQVVTDATLNETAVRQQLTQLAHSLHATSEMFAFSASEGAVVPNQEELARILEPFIAKEQLTQFFDLLMEIPTLPAEWSDWGIRVTAFLDANLADDLGQLDFSAFKNGITSTTLASFESRLVYIQIELVALLKKEKLHKELLQFISHALNLDLSQSEFLLTYDFGSGAAAPQFTALVELVSDPTAVEDETGLLRTNRLGVTAALYRCLHKMALIAVRHRLSAFELGELLGYTTAHQWLDLKTIPVNGSEPAVTARAWLGFMDVMQLRAAMAAAGVDFFGFMKEIRGLDVSQTLATLTTLYQEKLLVTCGWDASILNNWFTQDSAAEKTRLKTVAVLKTVFDVNSLSTTLGVAGTAVFSWTEAWFNDFKHRRDHGLPLTGTQRAVIDTAAAVKGVVKARYSTSQWYNHSEEVQNTLREYKRDALVRYLVNRGRFRDNFDLFGTYLIDTEMSSLQKTSRLKQAISSVQLFVERSLLDLEPGFILTREEKDSWNWRKRYRVWEAGRKVFFFPENWLEPQLRDNKSEIFQSLEDQLLQGDLSDAHTEGAYISYLDRLCDVANLDVCGLYHEEVAGDEAYKEGSNILHVIGRSRSLPHRYFYCHRRKFPGRFAWSSWQEVDANIESEHIIPVVFNRRFYLFWPSLHLQSDPDLQTNYKPAVQYCTWRFHWTSYQNGKWMPKQSMKELVSPRNTYGDAYLKNLDVKALASLIDPATFHFSAGVHASGKLVIRTAQHVFGNAYAHNLPAVAFTVVNGNPEILSSGALGFVTPMSYRPWYTNNEDQGYREMGFVTGSESGITSYPLAMPTNRVVQVGNKYMLTPTPCHVLMNTPGRFKVLIPHQLVLPPVEPTPFFYQGPKRVFMVTPKVSAEQKDFGFLDKPTPGSLWDFEIDLPIDPDIFVWDEWVTGKVIGDLLGNLGGGIPGLPGMPIPQPSPEPGPIGPRVQGDFVKIDAAGGIHIRMQPNTQYINVTQPGYTAVAATAHGGKTVGTGVYATMPQTVSMVMMPMTSTETAYYQLQAQAIPEVQNQLVRELLDVAKEDTYGWRQTYPYNVGTSHGKGYFFECFYHPYADEFVKTVHSLGVEGLLNPKPTLAGGRQNPLFRQELKDDDFFVPDYDPYVQPKHPATNVLKPFPIENVEFTTGKPYATYNQEVFYHGPLMIADMLMKSQRFAEAQKWLHFIFDPTVVSDSRYNRDDPRRYWRVKWFTEAPLKKAWDELLRVLHPLDSTPTAAEESQRDKLTAEIQAWEQDPFNPHLLARLRISAYQKAVVMKYLDNLVAWGDYLFRQDTLETLNEATQLYLLGLQILGPRPKMVKPKFTVADKSYDDLVNSPINDRIDELSNILVSLEQALPGLGDFIADDATPPANLPTMAPMFYFTLSGNTKMLEYWNVIEDRLFKLRHSLNIDGIFRTLALFEPPIDPALLVRARAQGLDLGQVLASRLAPQPFYRFQHLLGKAMEVCQEVKGLGSALLSALERKDAEELVLLQKRHEGELLAMQRTVRDQQIKEAREQLLNLQKARELAELRFQYYKNLQFMIEKEKQQVSRLGKARKAQKRGEEYSLASQIAFMFPDVTVGASGISSPVATFTIGGSTLGKALQAFSTAENGKSAQAQHDANLASIFAGHERRAADWKLQQDSAAKEKEQLDRQITAAEIRVALAERELQQVERQIAQHEEVRDFYAYKFTNHELYSWLVGQVSSLYFQCYQLAFDLAKTAERAFQRELGLSDSNYIQFGYWDNLHKGLMAGERLSLAIRRLENAYLEKNKREYELRKNVSLMNLDPAALMMLKKEGKCFIRLSEDLFDADYPGHYLRRLKSVGISLPCVSGPHASVNCRLVLTSHHVRVKNTLDSNDRYEAADNTNLTADDRFTGSSGLTEAMVTSHGRQDYGIFEPNLRDERFLPFEGYGAISEWCLELPKLANQFDVETLTDVVIHLNYTARDGGKILETKALQRLTSNQITKSLDLPATPLMRAFSLKRDFAGSWGKWQEDRRHTEAPQMNLLVKPEMFSYAYLHRQPMTISKIALVLDVKAGGLETLEYAFYEAGAPEGEKVFRPFVTNNAPEFFPADWPSKDVGNFYPYAVVTWQQRANLTTPVQWHLDWKNLSSTIELNDVYVLIQYKTAEQP